MSSLLIIIIASFLLGMMLTPLLRRLAQAIGLVDHPDGRRKMHAKAIPLAGGTVMLLSFLIALVSCILWFPDVQQVFLAHALELVGLLGAGVMLWIVGIADDFGWLRGRYKLLGQSVGVAVVVATGTVVWQIRVFDWTIDLGIMAIPFTMFWLLGCINSLNLLDGMDGLLATVTLFICVGVGAIAFFGNQPATLITAAALGGAVLAFSRYNLPPASTFMGDSGSMLLGLCIGVATLQCCDCAPGTYAIMPPLALLTLPVMDTGAAIIRRKLTGRSIYSTDRGHLHHSFLGLGYSSRQVLFRVGALSLLTCAGAIAATVLDNDWFALIAIVSVVSILVGTQTFGNAELRLLRGSLRVAFTSLSPLRLGSEAGQVEVRLQGSADWQALWLQLKKCAVELDLKTVRLDVNAPSIHESYHARWDRPREESENPSLWHAVLPLAIAGVTVGRLEICGERDHTPVCDKLIALARLVEDFEHTASLLARMANGKPPGNAEAGFPIKLARTSE